MNKLTINLPEGLEFTERQFQVLFADALAEFISHRGPTSEDYVNERYPNTPDYAWLDRSKKIGEVNQRKLVADRLHNAVLSMKLT